MADQNDKLMDSSRGYRLADKLLQSRQIDARKDEVLNVYQDVLESVWNSMAPILGDTASVAIISQTIEKTKPSFSLLGHIQVTAHGISIEQLRRSVSNEEPGTLRLGLKELIANLINILVLLTGDIVVKELFKGVEQADLK